MSTSTPSAGRLGTPGSGNRHLVGIVVGLATIIGLMLFAFAAPVLNSGAHDLPLAVSGPEAAVTQLVATLDRTSPGAFDATAHGSPEQAAQAIRIREAIGGIALTRSGITIQTAVGAGAPYAALLHGIGTQLQASGQQVTYTELAPTTPDDPTGAAVATLGLPLIFGGLASAAALLLTYRGATTARLAAALSLAVVGGLVATAILQFGFGAFDGNYWLISAAVAAGIAAISCTVLGAGTVLGYAGIGLGAVLMLFVSNPLSGLAAGPAWLPQPWGAIGQYLPLGAAGTAIRSAAYFDGNGAATAWLVLGTWTLAGIGLAYLGHRRAARTSPITEAASRSA